MVTCELLRQVQAVVAYEHTPDQHSTDIHNHQKQSQKTATEGAVFHFSTTATSSSERYLAFR